MLSYSYISEEDAKNSGILPTRANGGMDTGQQASGPWGSVPVTPDPIALSKNLLSAHPPPPPNAEKQPTTNNRPGNNNVEFPYHKKYKDTNLYCLT